MANVIETRRLRKVYRSRTGRTIALNNLDLTVPEGGVYGFLGPNGSGKTTTIRCLLGLIRPTSGSCRLLGHEVPRYLSRVVGEVGSIVETPRLFGGFSGRRNLDLLARMARINPRRVDIVLDRTGLLERGDDLVRRYSLGMKQRLGIAAALLKDPQVLVLDEPANGLDPAGIKEVRDLLRSLGAEGRTVFVSSHILSEVQQSCDRVAILSRGRCVAAGTVDEVLASSASYGLLVRVGNVRRALPALRAAGFEAEASGEAIIVNAPPEMAAKVTKALAERKLYLSELRPNEVTLEAVFLELTNERPEEMR